MGTPMVGIKNPLFIALDVDSAERALVLAEEVSEVAGGYKVGPRLIYRQGADLIRQIAKFGPVFVDCKFFDIPSVMEASVRAVFDSGATLCTIHGLAGPEALERLAKLEAKLKQERPFQILAVTVLTSFSKETLPTSFHPGSIETHVLDLARAASDAGLTGIVCSGEELPLFHEESTLKKLIKVCPGIRMKSDDASDQKRIVTPFEAFENGASIIVVGRPIVEHASPRQAAMNYACSLLGEKVL